MEPSVVPSTTELQRRTGRKSPQPLPAPPKTQAWSGSTATTSSGVSEPCHWQLQAPPALRVASTSAPPGAPSGRLRAASTQPSAAPAKAIPDRLSDGGLHCREGVAAGAWVGSCTRSVSDPQPASASITIAAGQLHRIFMAVNCASVHRRDAAR